MDDDLVCNFKKCRKRLSTFAWVTSCSHIFCDEDGGREFTKQSTCPACNTELPGKLDIVRVDLQPSDQYKSMVIAGQKPEVIMEICSRAMSFWTYQSHQERSYQEYCAAKAKEKAQQLESSYEKTVSVQQTEMNTMKTQLTVLKSELEATKSKCIETAEKLTERNRQYQKLQGMYEAIRRRSITPSAFEDQHRYSPNSRFLQHQFELPLGNAVPDKEAEFLKSQSSEQDSITSSNVTAVAQAQSNLRLDPALCAAVNSQVLSHQPQPADSHSLQPHEMFSLEIGAPKVPSAIAQRITKRI
ncbi:hypothetical protein EMCRGX_G024592 [Ephydatia muelleri]